MSRESGMMRRQASANSFFHSSECPHVLPYGKILRIAEWKIDGFTSHSQRRPAIIQKWETIGLEPTTPCLQSRCSPN